MDRVRNLRLAIMDGERCDYGIIFQDIQDTIDWDIRETFVKGLPNEIYLRVKVAGYHSLEDAYRQTVKATQELKRANDRTRYQHPTPPNNYNCDNVRPPNNNNNIGNNRQDRIFIPPLQNRPNAPKQNTLTCNYCKKPGHLIKDCYTFKARVDAGIIVPYASEQSGNRARPSGEQGESRRNDAPNRPRVQAVTRRPAPSGEQDEYNACCKIKGTIKYCGKTILQPREETNRRSRISKPGGKENTRIDEEEAPRVGLRFGRQLLRIISINLNDSPSTPTARIVFPDLKTKTSLLLDSGSEINIIKKPALLDSARINEQESIEIRGITATSLVH